MNREERFKRDISFVSKDNDYKVIVQKGLVDGMNVEGKVYVGDRFREFLEKELKDYHESDKRGSLPSLIQIANVATLPGIFGASIGLPDIHSGYGFAVGQVAAFDMDDPKAVVSPGGVGYDINCGVRLLRTNLDIKDIEFVKEILLDKLFALIPVGSGRSSEDLHLPLNELKRVLEEGMQWAVKSGFAWPEDCEFVEDRGCIEGASARSVGQRAIARGVNQLGTLGSGNHYVEIQYVEEIYDLEKARVMGIFKKGQVCIMLHCGSRGLGHQVCEEAVKEFDELLAKRDVILIDRQLSCSPIGTPEAQKYLSGMAAAANFAFVNRSVIATRIREAFEEIFGRSAREMDMNIVYDVAHNIAKIEEHEIDGQKKRLLVHRKGSSRAFGPGHPLVPQAYRHIGQPVLVGGSMGTCSYILTGTEMAMSESFGSTCHGAGRAMGRNQTKKLLQPDQVIENLVSKGISIRVGQMNAVTEEAPEAYKDVCEVVNICAKAGISSKVAKLTPVGVIKG